MDRANWIWKTECIQTLSELVKPMNDYDPLTAPEPDTWLALDEQERIALVQSHHQTLGVELESETLHAVIHAIVENQLAMQDEPVQQALDRLMKEGLDRHDALHAVGSVLAEHLWGTFNENAKEDTSPEKYYRDLSKLTAKKWLASG